jgi:hypothetical protein
VKVPVSNQISDRSYAYVLRYTDPASLSVSTIFYRILELFWRCSFFVFFFISFYSSIEMYLIVGRTRILFGFPIFWQWAYLLKIIPVMHTKLHIYDFVTITWSIPLLMDYQSPKVSPVQRKEVETVMINNTTNIIKANNHL